MARQFSAAFCKVPEGHVGFVEKVPGANTQGATLEEARTHLREAVILVVEANRMFALDDAPAGEVLREALEVTA